MKLFVVLALFSILIAAPIHAQDTVRVDSVPSYQRVVRDKPNTIIKLTHPPIVFEKWWKEIRNCAGLEKSLPEKPFPYLTWYVMYSDLFFLNNSERPVDGVTYAWHDEILITIPSVASEKIVKHEMLHYQLWQLGQDWTHNNPLFKKCDIESP